MNITAQQIQAALELVRYPGQNENIINSGILHPEVNIDGNKVELRLLFSKKRDPFANSLMKAVESSIHTHISPDIEVVCQAVFPDEEPKKPKPNMLAHVKNIVAVFSGKGGVGKSTVTANLAVALSLRGHKVGILDADIHGPSMPKMFGVEDERPAVVEIEGVGDAIEPVTVYNGIKMLSIGFFSDPDKALIWRGSMASNALQQLLTQGDWGELDFLLIDMPPGTGDIHLTLVQTIGLTGVVVVTTPQEVALIDARKGIDMFTTDKVSVPVLGLVENMAWFTPRELPENKYYIFGKEGGKRLAEEMQIPLLAQLPLVQSVCESGDSGLPIATHTDTMMAQYFDAFAERFEVEVMRRNEEEPPTQKVEITH